MSAEPITTLTVVEEQADQSVFTLTDLGNAERLVAIHGADIRHVNGIGWLAWDGRRWARDDTGEMMRRAKLTARAIYNDAANCDDDEDRKRIARWARASESEPRLRAMVNLAASEQAVVARAGDLDAEPFVLNVTTAPSTSAPASSAARPADLITKLAPVDYDPARAPRAGTTSSHASPAGTTSCSASCSASPATPSTGVTDEEILAFVHGPGATGKTTFVEALKAALGDYASTADFETFLARHGDGGIRNDIARLAGARMVVSVEVDDGKRLAEGLIKQITGGDKIAARFLHREFFEFTPQFTLWLVANARPRAHAGDDALWRRIVQVPFTEVIPPDERDPELKRALRTDPAEQTAILAWLVQGCLAWQRQGLDVPDRVRDYTEDYRARERSAARMDRRRMPARRGALDTRRELRAAYERWCEESGAKPIDAGRRWGDALKAHDCTATRRNRGRGWQGIELKPATEPRHDRDR